MNPFFHIIVLCLVAMFSGCTPEDYDVEYSKEYPGLVYKTFTSTKKVFPNPERGFYVGRNFYKPEDRLQENYVKAQRVRDITIIYTGYYLTDFMESDITQEYLDMIDSNMQVLRENGAKCLLRFAYKTDMYDTGHPWDATPEWVHRHIEQLKPVMQRNSDVVLCLQAGFIGVWGEWAYTDGFHPSPQTPEDFLTRKEVMLSLLDAMPENRQIAVRTPRYKRKMFLDSYADTVTLETAHNGSDMSRICGHNDCFGASANDYGTFVEEGERQFWMTETRYLMMGGETCNLSRYCKCEQTLKDMEDYHWTYLSGPSKISDRWKTDGCFDEIERRIGYRLSLIDVHHTAEPKAGENFRVVINLTNKGFAAPVNPRGVELVLVDGKGKKTVYELDHLDPRYWFAGGKYKIDEEVSLPSEAVGDCIIYLNLPDPEPGLHDNPLFSVRLANADVWESETGYNRLTEFKL